MIFELGDGDDYMTWSDARDIAYEVDAGDGDDEVRGFSSMATIGLRQTIDGGVGTTSCDGDLGNDVVRGGPGNDEVDGGAGDDRSRAATATTRCSATATSTPAPT